jgi:hypothetical protein
VTELRINAGAFRRAGVRRAMHVVEAITIAARDAVVDEMVAAEPRTGRTYKIPGTDSYYTASAPGESPAEREGLYLASIRHSPPVQDGDVIRGRAFTSRRVGDADQYVLGQLLEYGTGRMEPRPHWRPAFERVKPIAERIVRDASA